MRVVVVNHNLNSGGAAQYSLRLHHSLKSRGIDSLYYVNQQVHYDQDIIGPKDKIESLLAMFKSIIDSLWLRFYPRRTKAVWGTGLVPSLLASKINRLKPDIVHLNWISNGMLNLWDIHNIKAPIVWTLHDSWAFTGGCHLPMSCENYKHDCGYCPQLSSQKLWDLSHLIVFAKQKIWNQKKIHFIFPSQWLFEQGKKSSLLQNHLASVVSNFVDCEFFKPLDPINTRKTLQIPTEKKLIGFGATHAQTDSNKGYSFVKNLILSSEYTECHFVLWGDRFVEFTDPKYKDRVSVLEGYLDQHFLKILYSSLDLMLMPSQSENMPLTALESMACGTPLLAFAVGGLPELIQPLKNGFLCSHYDQKNYEESFAQAITYLSQEVRNAARKRVQEHFSAPNQLEKILKIYESMS